MKKAQRQTCPCGNGMYDTCCGPFHAGKPAPTAESLMRSRYSAYVLKLVDYLRATWHPDTRPAELSLDDDQTKWIGLDVRRASQDGNTAIVEFVARYKVSGRAARLHEVSRFVRESHDAKSEARWYYVGGELLEQ